MVLLENSSRKIIEKSDKDYVHKWSIKYQLNLKVIKHEIIYYLAAM